MLPENPQPPMIPALSEPALQSVLPVSPLAQLLVLPLLPHPIRMLIRPPTQKRKRMRPPRRPRSPLLLTRRAARFRCDGACPASKAAPPGHQRVLLPLG